MTPTQHEFLELLHRVNQVAGDRFSRDPGSGELTLRQVQLLSAVAAHEEPSHTDLCAATGIDRSTMTIIVKRLVEKKLLERNRSKRDARAYIVRLTSRGLQELERGGNAASAVEDHLLGSLSTKQKADFVAQLRQVAKTGNALNDH